MHAVLNADVSKSSSHNKQYGNCHNMSHVYIVYSLLVSVQIYVVEISPAVGKGLFGALNQLAITIGILAIEAFGIGNVLKYYHLAILPMMVILLFTVLGIFLRETPRWLLSKDQIKQSTQVLQLLRGTQYDKEVDELHQPYMLKKAISLARCGSYTRSLLSLL